MKSIPYKVSCTDDQLTSRSGLLLVTEIMNRLGLSQLAERYFPSVGSNRGYDAWVYVRTFLLMLHEGAVCLEDVRSLRRESALLKLLGIRRIPSSDALGDWLRRLGCDGVGIRALGGINRCLLGTALHRCREVTLDMDATAVLCNKRGARWTYLQERGYLPMVGHIEQTGQVVAVAFRSGNVSPSQGNLEFIRCCESRLPAGVRVSAIRIDAAGYQSQILDYASKRGMAYAIRARLTASIKEMIRSRPESFWQPVLGRDGQVTGEESCRFVHVMEKSERPFLVVAQRRKKRGQQRLPEADDSVGLDTDYIYRAIATNQERMSDSEVIHWYNQRAEHSENRIKELKLDMGADRLPCSDFHANELYFHLCATAWNLFALLRLTLPPQWLNRRAGTVRHRLFSVAGKVVCHSRQWTLKIQSEHYALLSEALYHTRRFALAP